MPRPMGHPDFDDLNLGYTPNPAGVRYFMDRLPHPGELAAAAPDWMGDGMTGDLMPYLAYYDVEIKDTDGTTWKPKDVEPPYRPQTGNNCTSEGLMHAVDLLQMMDASAGQPDDQGTATVFHRTCVEAVYAFGLFKANMRGDQGCYGAPIAQAASEIGVVSYRDVEPPHEESGTRLRQWANDPSGTVERLRDKAGKAKVGAIARVTTWEELCGALANRRIVTVASDVGYNAPRDEQGICPRRGSWAHQMCFAGILRSDGVETAVILQSWGPHMPQGPQPFKLPSFAFRVHKQDALAQLAAGDSWSIGNFPGFERAPLPSKWTNKGWAG